MIKAGQKIIIPIKAAKPLETIVKKEKPVEPEIKPTESGSLWGTVKGWFGLGGSGSGSAPEPKPKIIETFEEGEGDLGGEVREIREIKEAEESIRKYAKNSKEAEVAIEKLYDLISEIDEASEEDLRALREKNKETNGFITTLKKLNPFQVSDAEAAVPLIVAAEACAANPACAAGLAALGAATLVAGKSAIESTYEFVKGLQKDDNSVTKIKGGDVKQKVTTAASGGGMPDPDDDWDPKKSEYEDAPYHHKNSKGIKSPSPDDGLEKLKHSMRVKQTSDQRIFADKAKNEFVVFMRHESNKYHGHVKKWVELTQEQKNVLINARVVKPNGKFL